MRKLYIDLETYSTVDLRKATPYRYAEDPAFQILMAAWSIDGQEVQVALGHEAIQAIPGLWDPQVLKVAHNAPFERICLSRLAGLPTGRYLPAEEWHDTQAIAGELGYPQRLESLAPALGATPKDTAGTALINWFCKPDRKGNRRLPEDYPEKWLDFVFYCDQDVATLIEVDQLLGGWPTSTEHQVYLADQVVNDTGIRVDVALARRAVEAAEENRTDQELEITAMTGVENPGSQPQMLKWCQGVGLGIDNLQAATVEGVLARDDLDDDVRRVMELRQELALVASKKFQAALDAVSTDERLRGSFRFFGAHTGRWTGRGVQLQNLPRESFDNVVDTELAVEELRAGQGASAVDLKRLVRPMFLGPMTVVDYAAIEARVIAWLANEAWALKAFRDGRDIYVETAERMGGLTRAQGKVAVLALGYAGGINSLRAMGASGNDDELQMLVYQWRKANPKIVRLWNQMEEAVAHGGTVGPRLALQRSGGELRMHLPSGRQIGYHGVRWERYMVIDPKTGRKVRKEGWRYDDPKRPGQRIGTYGGRLVENATQAVARDVLAEALVRLVDRGYRPVGHVHDEILVEGDLAVEEVRDVMTEVPEWAEGLPVDGEGYTCQRYRKG